MDKRAMLSSAKEHGDKCRGIGMKLDGNPYGKGTALNKAWAAGWKQRDKKKSGKI